MLGLVCLKELEAHFFNQGIDHEANSSNSLAININTATAVELAEALDGVGEVRAAAIIALREKLGGFVNLEQLLEINGIGVAMLSRISSIIVLE